MTSDGAHTLSIWTIYENPSDEPGWFVARRDELAADASTPKSEVYITRQVEVLRDMLRARGLTCLPRHPDDEQHIVECWI